MADILHRITVAATPEKISPLVTTANGFRTWWTDDCEAVPKVGSVAIFRFDGGAVEFHFRLDELSPGRAAFTCVPAPKVPAEWVGTRLTFDLAPAKRQRHGRALRPPRLALDRGRISGLQHGLGRADAPLEGLGGRPAARTVLHVGLVALLKRRIE